MPYVRDESVRDSAERKKQERVDDVLLHAARLLDEQAEIWLDCSSRQDEKTGATIWDDEQSKQEYEDAAKCAGELRRIVNGTFR